MDKYVDGVDRLVNMHKKPKNIYTSDYYRFMNGVAWLSGRGCKKHGQNPAAIEGLAAQALIAFARPVRNKFACPLP